MLLQRQVNTQRHTAQYPHAITVVPKIFNFFMAKRTQNSLLKCNIRDIWDFFFFSTEKMNKVNVDSRLL